MRSSSKRVFLIVGSAAVLSTMFFGFYLWKVALVVSGYQAKSLCSSIFVSGREAASVLSEDLRPVGALYPLRFCDAEIDYAGRTVTASIRGFAERKAIYREGLGCTLVIGATEEQLRSGGIPVSRVDSRRDQNGTWPDGEMVDTRHPPPEVDGGKLDEAVAWAFVEPHPDRLRRTRAVVVVYDGKIVAERYAPGFTAGTPLPGWSMTKSVFAALSGILIHEGRISLESNALLPLWREGQDPRRAITLAHLLHMSCGLAFEEEYSSPLSDVVVMLFGTGDMASFAAGKPLESVPGVRWSYSSGATNIISKVMRNAFGNAHRDYLEFPRRALFDRIGMQSAVVEPDPSGTFVGSSSMYATARDWARFGLLNLRGGLWGEDRILPEGWTKYCATPAPASVEKDYGAHFWLCVTREFRRGEQPSVRIPRDAYHAIGYDGQFVSIIPSRKLVVVRLGMTRSLDTWDQEELIDRILNSFRDK